MSRSFSYTSVVRAITLAVVSLIGMPAHAAFIVGAGYDLLYTLNATYEFGGSIGPVDFVGVPLNTYDFGAGPVPVGATDTILHRTEQASVGGAGQTDTIQIELIALSLRSVDPVDIGAGPELLNVVLLGDLGSTMSIEFDDMAGGTFGSDLNFQILFQGATSGSQTASQTVNMGQTGSQWGRVPEFANFLIDGINFNLDDEGGAHDFFTGIAEHGPDHTHGTIDINAVPMPAPGVPALVLTGIIIFAARRHIPLRKILARAIA